MLPRVHLFEWNDQPWLPEILRRFETEHLAAVIDLTRPFASLAPKIAALAGRHGDRIVDLVTPFVRPWSGWRLLFTCVLPIDRRARSLPMGVCRAAQPWRNCHISDR